MVFRGMVFRNCLQRLKLYSIYNNVIPPHIIRYPLGENEYLLQRIIRTDDNSVFVLVDVNGNTYNVEIEDRDWLQELLQSSRRLYETVLESDLNERINSRAFGALMDNIVIKGTLVPIGASRYTLKAPTQGPFLLLLQRITKFA